MPSTDHRHRSAEGDIAQHRVAFTDWPDDWVFFDKRFNLLRGSDEGFLRFLAEVVHPVVRPDTTQSRAVAAKLNAHLGADGWQLVESTHISGRPVFVAIRVGARRSPFAEPTGWLKVDRQVQEAGLRLRTGSKEEHFQAVGLLCREILISLAQECYDAAKHAPADGPAPSLTDAGRMLEGFVGAELSGGSNEEARAHGKAALRLALALQHQRSADFRTAALCVEATSAVVNLVAILAGRRG